MSSRTPTQNSHEQSAQRTANPFKKVHRKQYGYNPQQVDSFISRAQRAYHGEGTMSAQEVSSATFDAIKGGYAAHQVDQVLDRLEDAFARAERDTLIEEQGVDAWNAQLDETIRVIMHRLNRAAGERFRRPSRASAMSYRTEDVDNLCQRLKDHFADSNHLSVTELRTVTFRAAQGAEGYEEAQVDAFIQDVINLIVVLD